MNADELESLFQASPCETEATASLRATRFARFGVLAAPSSGQEARVASETISAALARRPPRLTATEWDAALRKAESFWHSTLRPKAEKFLTLPVGPRLRYHVWESPHADVDVVLLHNLGDAGGGLSDLGIALARRGYRVWAPDFRGHGDSDRARPYDEKTLAGDLRSFIVELDLYRKPVVLVGFGLGAFLALVFAASHPALTGGIVLLDADVDDPGATYRFHPSQAATFKDVRAAVDRACAPQLLELLASPGAETPRGGFRRDATRALQRMRWAVRDQVVNAENQVVTKMDPEWCFVAARDAKVRGKSAARKRRGEENVEVRGVPRSRRRVDTSIRRETIARLARRLAR